MIDYSQLQLTRDFLQDIAKVMGKTQQCYLLPDNREWYKGLEITVDGLQTQELAHEQRIILNFKEGLLVAKGLSLNITQTSAQEVLEQLQEWVKQDGFGPIEQPILTTDKPSLELSQATALAEAVATAQKHLSALKQKLQGLTSPILLYPHHFDVSLGWFSNNVQYTFGFSTGDETIAEPYFYITATPEPPDFKSISLPRPAFWQEIGFKGAILKYNNVVASKNPQDVIEQYFNVVLK